jgi:alpha/beta hydrolase fold
VRVVRRLLGTAAAAGIGYLALVAWRGIGIPALRPGTPAPATDPAEAVARVDAARDLDAEECVEACRSFLLEPEDSSRGTFVFFHGFTNCPDQFREVGALLRDRGFRVLVTRQPYHGLGDRLTRSLRNLTPAEIIEYIDRTIDVAAGFEGPLRVLGMSGGGVQAAWAAATRSEVDDVLVIAPAAAPEGTPVPLVRLFVRFRSRLPDTYIWWDPVKKLNRVQSEYEYPGFPLPGIIPILYLAIELGDRRVVPTHHLDRAILLTNPHDHAVSRPAGRWMMRRAFKGHAREVREVRLARALRWGHDFIDPAARYPGDPAQVADVVLAAFGLTDDTSGGGLLAPGAPL